MRGRGRPQPDAAAPHPRGALRRWRPVRSRACSLHTTRSAEQCPQTLSRSFGKETITVVVDVVEESGEDEEWDDEELPEGEVTQEGEAEEEEEEELASTFFSVTVAKGDKSVVFECVTDGVEVDIMRVDMGSEEEDAYTGPDFGSLDESLQDAFADFLADRGVDGALAEYLVEAAVDKEQREYMGWLKSMAAFARSK